MRKTANVFLLVGAVVALRALFPIAPLASDGGDPPQEPAKQEGEDRWVPSLAITGGATIQAQQGLANSLLFENTTPPPVALRGVVEGDDLAVAPFVGGSLELMTPALPIPTRPRLFLSGEILPTFEPDHAVAVEGDPGCVRGPEPDAPCARDEPPGVRDTAFSQDAANGVGSTTTAWVDTLVFGAGLGVAFPVQLGKRQLRIKPSVGWIHYEVEAEGVVVDALCDPTSRCTDVTVRISNPFPPPPYYEILREGFLREIILEASGSKRFNGIGPGLDAEMDTGRFGPLGVSLFLGARAYYIPGDRTISFGTSEVYSDQLGTDRAVGQFEVEVDPWMFRAHVGIRLQWLGSPQ